MPTNYAQKIADQLKLRPAQVAAAIDLLDAGNTLPFVARYRKEATGSLDEDQIRRLLDSLTRLRAVDERRETIIASIEEQGQMTDDLRRQIEAAESLTALEDLYAPYRPKRRTRAGIAREKGLQGLADLIVQQPLIPKTAEQIAADFLNEQVATPQDALAGARDIVAEAISDHADVRGQVRDKAMRFGLVQCAKNRRRRRPAGRLPGVLRFPGRVDRLKPYQVLAINRGEAEKVLRVRLDVAERDWRLPVESVFRANPRSPLAEQLALAIEDAAARLLLPAIERDVRRALTEQAEAHAIQVFAANLRGLLTQPPSGRTYRFGHRSRFSHGLQGRRCRSDRQGRGYGHDLSP